VGTITFNQGLQLLVSILPEILKKYPQLKVNIIGQGPFSKELIEMVKDKALDDYFIFHGFIEEEEKMLDIVAHSALGLAIWDDSLQSDHIKFADSGKPKLYALCGIPVIVSGIASIASEIERHKAGFVIKYNPKELTKTLDYLLKSDETLSLYRQNAASLGKEFTSEYIFDYAFQETAKIIDNLKK
jgi:glycosyltransferase involved in cell wall biosynthesis